MRHQHIYYFANSVAALLRLLHPVHRRVSAIRRACLRNRCPQQSYAGRGRIRFLKSDLRDCSLSFFKFFITAHLRLCRMRAEGRHLQRELRQTDRRLHPIVIVKEPHVTCGFFSQIMSYILSMLICVGMIL
jgi:hypothetical protein